MKLLLADVPELGFSLAAALVSYPLENSYTNIVSTLVFAAPDRRGATDTIKEDTLSMGRQRKPL